jgi:hypothetical protein
MLANRSKTSISGPLGISLLCCLLGIVGFTWYQKSNACFDDRPPLKSFVVTVDKYQERWLIKPSQKFADKNGFSFQMAYYDQHGRDFSIWMKRKDVEVIAVSPFKPGEFKIGFYDNDCLHPTVASDIDGLVRDLKSSIKEEIPNVTITEKK